jgi:hypothetical protein
MILHGRRTRRAALIAGQLLVLILVVSSNRALFAPAAAVTKAQDSKRPKTPKNVVPAEPVRVPMAEKQGQDPTLARLDAVAADLVTSTSRTQTLPSKAFTQLTKPDYLKSDSPGSPHIPLSPPV